MLEVTLARVQGNPLDGLSFSQPMVIGAGDADILMEPVGKNSAAPVAAAALSAAADDLVLILPADHDIADLGAFHRAILAGDSVLDYWARDAERSANAQAEAAEKAAKKEAAKEEDTHRDTAAGEQ